MHSLVFDHGPPTAPRCVPRPETSRVRPEPLSLINWMIPRHSASPVSYCPDWPPLPRAKPNNKTSKSKKRPILYPAAVRRAWPGATPSRPRLASRSSTEKLTPQHASIALVETECNAGQGWAGFPQQSTCMCPLVAAPVMYGPNSKEGSLWASAYLASCLSSICRDRCIRRAQFPRPPLITNVGGCGGQSSGHAPPRRLVPDCWLSFSMCQFETHRVESQPQLRDCRSHNSNCVTRNYLTSSHTASSHLHTHPYPAVCTHLAISSWELRSPIHPRRDRKDI